VVLKGLKLPEEKAFKLESTTFAKLAVTDVSRNLVGIFFAQNESKKMPADVKSLPKVKTVGVLGAGVMGAGIAQAAAKAGYKVVVKDVGQKFLDKGKATIEGLFDGLVSKGRLSSDESKRIVGEMKMTTKYDDMQGCDLVIEAVLEDLKIKQDALAELAKSIGNEFIFATNTSSLSVDKIAEGYVKPENVVGLHFFNPVNKMPLVEVIQGKRTSKEAVSQAMSVALKLEKTTVIAADSPGFIVNRILAPYLREAALLAEEGVAIEDIDKAMKAFGMPLGPLALLDEIGLDVAAKVIHVMREALGDRMNEPKLMGDIAALKILGKKGGKGIYLYNEKGRPDGVNPDVAACIKAPPQKKMAGEIQDRLVLLMLNEAARCLEENVVSQAAQLDLAMIFGTGYPPFQGGILRYADSIGIRIVYDKLDYISRAVNAYYAPCALLAAMAEKRETFYRYR
jgi:3-hydroxyacyl-CoA dehydrogenase/enoyl-CoA hydratase/3-hydroxybutyryl-CoA epimerase